MLVCTLNSAVASGDGTKLRLLGWFVSVPVFGTPSSRNSLVNPRPPLIWKLSMPPLSNGRFERLAVAGVYCTPGRQLGEHERVAAEQRQVGDLLATDDLAAIGAAGVEDRGLRANGHFLGEGAELHRQVETQAIADAHFDALALGRREPVQRHGEVYRPIGTNGST